MTKETHPFQVWRKAVLMEDHGREEFMAAYIFKMDAENWIKQQKGKYHGPGDYYIKEVKQNRTPEQRILDLVFEPPLLEIPGESNEDTLTISRRHDEDTGICLEQTLDGEHCIIVLDTAQAIALADFIHSKYRGKN
ncbi:hypothetical protein EVB27_099 [Rhizobium phage RHph_TM16]|nr:hypothetical protein EVB27_099 [Rhizobium phage RHph_TM16]